MPFGVAGEVAVGETAHDATGDGVAGLEIEAVGGSGHGIVLADFGTGESALAVGVESHVGDAVVATTIDGNAEALVLVAGEAGVPCVPGEALQAGSGLEAEVAHVGEGLIAMGVGVVDGGGAALLAAGADAGLDAHLLLGFGCWLLGLALRLGRFGGLRVAARALARNGVRGWDGECQQNCKTARRTHRYWESSMGVRQQATAGCGAAPIRY